MRNNNSRIYTLLRRGQALRLALILAGGIATQWSCSSGTEPEAPLDPRTVLHLEAVTPTSLSGIVGSDVISPPSVRLTGRDGKPMAGVQVAFTTPHGGVLGSSIATSDETGIASVGRWQLGTVAGIQTFTAHCCGFTVAFTASVAPGPVASLEVLAGDDQAREVESVVPIHLRVRVRDSFSNPVGGARVTFSVVSGAGAVSPDTTNAGQDGVASTSWTLGTQPGHHQVRAQSEGATVLLTAEACERQSCPQLLFVRAGNIYTFRPAGGESARQLTSDGRSFNPAWSPDGRRIAFARSPAATAMSVDVYIMDADGSNVERRTSGTPFHSPSWAPDGQALALAGDWWLCVYECAIYRLELGGHAAAPRRLAPMGADPAWSPDGKKIAFVSLSGDDGYHALYIMNADGTGITTVVPRDQGSINHPVWSPDGGQIAFSKCRGTCDIYVAASNGFEPKQLTAVGDASWPSWSPDGKRIAFSRWSYGVTVHSIHYVNIAGGGPVELVWNAHSPGWRP